MATTAAHDVVAGDIAMIGGTGSQIDGAAYGRLPTFTQTAGSPYNLCCLLSQPPVIIATDYEQLVTGWELGPGTFTQASSRGGEAWKLFWDYAEEYGRDNVQVRKVAAHKAFRAVAEGQISFRDWCGNKKADELAKCGAKLHPCNSAQVQAEVQQIRRQHAIVQYIG